MFARMVSGSADASSSCAGAIRSLKSAKKVEVSESIRQRITSCRDLATLDRWLVRAATANSAEAVF
jgi:hypothetical protein